jgi:hypothetical protein
MTHLDTIRDANITDGVFKDAMIAHLNDLLHERAFNGLRIGH